MNYFPALKASVRWLKRYRHESLARKRWIDVSIYCRQQAETQNVPVLYLVVGLTCTDENFMQKSRRLSPKSAELGLAIVWSWDQPALAQNIRTNMKANWLWIWGGVYVNATVEPWFRNTYHMYDYVFKNCRIWSRRKFPVLKTFYFWPFYGGHGALICAVKNPGKYQSVFGFAPIVESSRLPLRRKKPSPVILGAKDQALGKRMGRDLPSRET